MARSKQEIYEELLSAAERECSKAGGHIVSRQVDGTIFAVAEQLANMEAAIERLQELAREEESREAE